MKLPAILVTVLVTAMALAGCSASPLPGSTVAAGGNASTVPNPPPTKPAANGGGSGGQVNVCSAVSLAKVNAITGRTYASATAVTSPTEGGCKYDGSDPSALSFSLGVYFKGGTAKFNELVSGLGLGDPAKPIFDLGDEAVDVNQAVIAQYGTDVLFAADAIHPGDQADLPQSAYVKLIAALQAAR